MLNADVSSTQYSSHRLTSRSPSRMRGSMMFVYSLSLPPEVIAQASVACFSKLLLSLEPNIFACLAQRLFVNRKTIAAEGRTCHT